MYQLFRQRTVLFSPLMGSNYLSQQKLYLKVLLTMYHQLFRQRTVLFSPLTYTQQLSIPAKAVPESPLNDVPTIPPTTVLAGLLYTYQLTRQQLYLISRYQRSSMILDMLSSSVRAQAMFWPTPGGCWNLQVKQWEEMSSAYTEILSNCLRLRDDPCY